MTYVVAYFDGLKISGMPFQCPTYSRQLFEKKKQLEMPCALIKKEEGKATLIDSFRYEFLEQHCKVNRKTINKGTIAL